MASNWKVSISKLEEDFREDLNLSKSVLSIGEKETYLAKIKEQSEPLKRVRGHSKRKITCLLKTLKSDDNLNSGSLENSLELVPPWLDEIKKYESLIENILIVKI